MSLLIARMRIRVAGWDSSALHVQTRVWSLRTRKISIYMGFLFVAVFKSCSVVTAIMYPTAMMTKALRSETILGRVVAQKRRGFFFKSLTFCNLCFILDKL